MDESAGLGGRGGQVKAGVRETEEMGQGGGRGESGQGKKIKTAPKSKMRYQYMYRKLLNRMC